MENDSKKSEFIGFQKDFFILKLMVGIPAEPTVYIPIGSFIVERIELLREKHKDDTLLISYKRLYSEWQKQLNLILRNG